VSNSLTIKQIAILTTTLPISIALSLTEAYRLTFYLKINLNFKLNLKQFASLM